MNWLQKLFSGKKAYNYSNQFGSTILNGQLISPTDNKEAYLTNGYLLNDIIYSIINLILDKVRMPEWNQYKVIDESSLKSYLGLMRKKEMSFDDHKKALDLKTKALELTAGDGKIAELLRWPNDEETFGDFVAGGVGYKLITGDKYMYGDMLPAGANMGKPNMLYNLPSQHMKIHSTDKFPSRITGYSMFAWDNLKFKPEEVMHEKYWNPEWGLNGQNHYGLSPLKAALYRTARNNAAIRASASTYLYGMKGVIAIDDTRFTATETEEQTKALKKKIMEEYSGPDNHGKIAASGYKVQWTPISLSPVDLQIIESEKWDMNRLCAIYGVPPPLVGNDSASTYNNVETAEKALTARCAMPRLIETRENLNHKTQTDWGLKGKNIFIDFDQTCFTELEENMKDKIDWVMKMWWLSPEEMSNMLGIEISDEPLFKQPWVNPNERVPLSEFKPNAVDEALNEEDDLAGDK